MSLLFYNSQRIRLDVHNGGPIAEIADGLSCWRPGDDHTGLALVYDLIQALPSGGFPLWWVDVAGIEVVVLAHFCADAEGAFVHNGELTLSIMINGAVEIAGTGISDLGELTEFTAEQDGPTRVLGVLDAVTDHLNAALTQALRFTPALTAHQRRSALPPPVARPQPTEDDVPSIDQIAAQSRREISCAFPLGTAGPLVVDPRMPPWIRRGASAEELMAARAEALQRDLTSIRLEVLARTRGWFDAGCPSIRIVSLTPGAGSEFDTEIVLSNGLRLLASPTGVLLSDTRGRLLYFLDLFNREEGQEILDLELSPSRTSGAALE